MPLNPQPKTLNPATLLSLFDRVAEAPSAIPRLRQFILDLAVRGKLVEPGAPSPFASLSNLCTSRSGNGKMIKGTLSATPGEGLYPCYSASGQDVWHDHFDHDGDAVIVSAVGARCGKAFVATGKWSAIANTHILFPKAEVCSLPYLHLIANNEALWIRGGSAQPFVKVAATLQDRKVYLPPLAEQHRIVAKVDELMALCDRLETAQAERETRRTRLLASTHASLSHSTLDPRHSTFFINTLPRLTTSPTDVPLLRQTILNLAVRGKLVPQDPDDEPASETLAHLAAQKFKAGAAKTGRDWVGESRSSVPQAFAPPPGWAWTRIGNTVERVTVGYVGPMKDQYVDQGIPFLRSQNVRPNRFRPEGLINISPQFHRGIIKSGLAPGDVVVVRSGNVGTACSIPPSLPEANCSDLVVVKKPTAVLPNYLCFYLNSLAAVHIKEGTVGVALTHFNTKSVATMPLPLPPLAEQHRIVAKVDELMALCDRLEAQLTTTQTQSRRLLESTLHQALTLSSPA